MSICKPVLKSVHGPGARPIQGFDKDNKTDPALQLHLERLVLSFLGQVLPKDPLQHLHPQHGHDKISRTATGIELHLPHISRDVPLEERHHARRVLRGHVRQHLHPPLQLHDLRVRGYIRSTSSHRSSL